MSKILLLLENKENLRLLTDMLSQNYEVVIVTPEQLTTTKFDLCIIDALNLCTSATFLQVRKQMVQPLFLPVFLVISQQHYKKCPLSVWQIVDEIATLPIPKLELHMRINVLLRLRQNSLMMEMIREELADKNNQLEKVNEEKNRFVGMAAHDLRSPISGIISLSELLLTTPEIELGHKQIQWLTLIQDSSELMLRIINGLLDISAIEAGKLELQLRPTNLIELTKKNVSINQLLAEKKQITLHLDYIDSVPLLRLDPFKMEQILNNLISNAIKFSHVSTAIYVKLYQELDQLIIAVKDQGQGIPDTEQVKLFQPFARIAVRSTAGERGTGLGLAIVKKMVEAQQGKIWAESKKGHGSTFYVAFPLTQLTTVQH